jgi:GntR family transcriptional regulator, negative regulator for fad regulon and positive regulator of fabA
MEPHEKYVNPAQFAEIEIIKSILSGKFAIGQALMPERELAVVLGITRPTLREVLQRLSSDGWITIKHGRPTIVNDYINKGGLSVLKQFVHFSEFASRKLVVDWLEFRVLIFPYLAQKAVDTNTEEINKFLEGAPNELSEASDFSKYDWELQLLLIRLSDNVIAKMLYNDLSDNYLKQAAVYFATSEGRKMSMRFYNSLKECISNDPSMTLTIVKIAMEESLLHWIELS